MPVTVVVGCQWGDEGKGKIIDSMAGEADWVARFQGGANAGHTLSVGGKTHVLHLIPSGILRPDVRCILGNGVVIDPFELLKEVAALEAEGIDVTKRLQVSRHAHCVTPIHRWEESLSRADEAIGTTRRGIGPSYEGKVARRGLRMEAFLAEAPLREGLERAWELWDAQRLAKGAPLPEEAAGGVEGLIRRFLEIREQLIPLLEDTTGILLDAVKRGERILAEGAQGALLDVDHGTYPYVTSSHTISGSVCIGLGLPPTSVDRIIGIAKAYTTRVGEGPFPTEMEAATAEPFRRRAGEYGATTGRPRRCGWLDLVLLRRAVELNGVTGLVITKLDILQGMRPLKICTSYQLNGRRVERSDASPMTLKKVQPVYEEVEGWNEPLPAGSDWTRLSRPARMYVRRIAETLDCRVDWVSVGPERESLIRVG
ncbi:MAG: adenylosuccinate synthase [Candidatus Eisenbacteria bacterium]|uniref:Adenylosuccinate synthetase n=1 Tax=Eiseniibacteriota bacterium TaxID=2212470 RepID=A0A948W8S6_UNCEI|nr:adenylosuccinate synthase [Candidatus Eisenbacteria bacterium]MBU2692996.1 adenylosuccinate synthase [Candidatus Eisenbacteria bacterium]